MKKLVSLLLMLIIIVSLVGCNQNSQVEKQNEDAMILFAAAASLKNCMDNEIIPMFTEKHPNIKVNTTYDSSGKLQTQIEEGAEIDVFMSAAMKQMNTLNEKGLIMDNSIVELLENKIVLIVPEGSNKPIGAFEDIVNAETIAIGDPESVPAGQYAKESLTNLNLWDQVLPLSSLGTNVTEVLNWVAEGSADVGVVYATDAASNDGVKVVAEAPEKSVSKVIYPVGIVKETKNEESARLFTEFLQSQEALNIFKTYGFSVNK